MKSLFASKSFWFNLATIAASAAATAAQLIPPTAGTAGAVLGVVNVVLRLVTHQGVYVVPPAEGASK